MEAENANLRQETGMSSGKILGLIPMFLLLVVIILRVSWVIYKSTLGQKTRNTQQRRMYTGSRTRQLSMQGEPTIFVSPANLPPPPKYEAMAPPSYEEVMAIQYPPGFQQGQQPQPITQPITHAMAQGSTSTEIPAVHTVTNNTSNGNARCTEVVTTAPAIVTVTNEERRTSVTVSARA
ncbi:hypothetical protein ABMA27_010049 [Loxostege sticticalis]|uniref:Uncharacterized protein n=1 Tax=Loxostege sticticalis TaxID=481309 RepID=A0ABR3H7D1_LOXSC